MSTDLTQSAGGADTLLTLRLTGQPTVSGHRKRKGKWRGCVRIGWAVPARISS